VLGNDKTAAMDWHIAQLNVGRLHAPIGDPRVAEFEAALDHVNELADAAPGFVWRLQTDDGNATAIKVTDDELFIVNMSVWDSVESLADFVYRSAHTPFLRRRAEWFERSTTPYLALWWVPAGTVPTLDDAMTRLAHLTERGPSPVAFTFRQRFAPDDVVVASDDRDACPA